MTDSIHLIRRKLEQEVATLGAQLHEVRNNNTRVSAYARKLEKTVLRLVRRNEVEANSSLVDNVAALTAEVKEKNEQLKTSLDRVDLIGYMNKCELEQNASPSESGLDPEVARRVTALYDAMRAAIRECETLREQVGKWDQLASDAGTDVDGIRELVEYAIKRRDRKRARESTPVLRRSTRRRHD